MRCAIAVLSLLLTSVGAVADEACTAERNAYTVADERWFQVMGTPEHEEYVARGQAMADARGDFVRCQEEDHRVATTQLQRYRTIGSNLNTTAK